MMVGDDQRRKNEREIKVAGVGCYDKLNLGKQARRCSARRYTRQRGGCIDLRALHRSVMPFEDKTQCRFQAQKEMIHCRKLRILVEKEKRRTELHKHTELCSRILKNMCPTRVPGSCDKRGLPYLGIGEGFDGDHRRKDPVSAACGSRFTTLNE